MKTEIKTITPKWAAEVLEKHNPRNRNVSENTVSSYASDMKNKRWTLTHQGIAFDENGDLIDGQHRLWAVVFADVEVEMMVTTGIPTQQVRGGILINSMDNIDHMRVRNTGQQMQLCHGIKNGARVAAGLRGICGIVSPANGAKRLSTANSLFLYELYGADVEAVMAALDNKQCVSHITAPLAMYHHGEPSKALEFCYQLRTLDRLTPSTRYVLKYLEQQHSTGSAERTVRIIAKCIHHFHSEIKIVKSVQDDTTGIKFLCAMFPSLNKRIADAIKPVAGLKIINRKK